MEVNDLVRKSREITKNIGRLTDGSDCIVFDEDSTVAKDSAFRIHGYNYSIVKYDGRVGVRFCHRSSSLYLYL